MRLTACRDTAGAGISVYGDGDFADPQFTPPEATRALAGRPSGTFKVPKPAHATLNIAAGKGLLPPPFEPRLLVPAVEAAFGPTPTDLRLAATGSLVLCDVVLVHDLAVSPKQ